MVVPVRRKDRPREPAGDPARDLLAHLASCHERIRAFLAEAGALAKGDGTAEARRASAEAIAHYFRHGLPHHARDEDASIAPHLPAKARELVRQLAEEHARIDTAIADLLPDWDRWARGGPSVASPAHLQALERLASTLETHLALEEAQLFPWVGAIPEPVAESIIETMRERRRRR